MGDQFSLRPVGHSHAQYVTRLYLGVAICAHDADWRMVGGQTTGQARTHQISEELERIAAGPLEVVEHQQDAVRVIRDSSPRDIAEEASDRSEHQAPLLVWR